MKRKRPDALSRIRQRQRLQAKKRFEERFDLQLNRDRLHEIENRIASGQVMHLESKAGRRNYFVEVDGKLVVVGYSPSTKRVVTVLPQEYIEQLPPELVTRARFTLLPSVKEQIIASIVNGNATLLHETPVAQYYEVEFEGLRFKTGYRSSDNRLVQCARRARNNARSRGTGLTVQITKPDLPLMEVPEEIGEAFRKQICAGTSVFLWRYSKTVTFHQVTWNGEMRRVGYSNTRKILFWYQDPPEDMAELRSSLRLLIESQHVQDAIAQVVRDGGAELLHAWDEDDGGSYKVEYQGEVFFFDYSKWHDGFLPWSGGLGGR